MTPPTGWKPRAERLLLDRGASEIAHPGGTLFEHVRRVGEMLLSWGSSENVQAAGLCHACYGTDGFATAPLRLHERPLLTEAIGADAEAIVYLYACCDRSAVYPRLGVSNPLFVTDRFTSTTSALGEQCTRDLLELTAANELDLVLIHPHTAPTWGVQFHRLLLRGRDWLSPEALAAWEAAVRRN